MMPSEQWLASSILVGLRLGCLMQTEGLNIEESEWLDASSKATLAPRDRPGSRYGTCFLS